MPRTPGCWLQCPQTSQWYPQCQRHGIHRTWPWGLPHHVSSYWCRRCCVWKFKSELRCPSHTCNLYWQQYVLDTCKIENKNPESWKLNISSSLTTGCACLMYRAIHFNVTRTKCLKCSNPGTCLVWQPNTYQPGIISLKEPLRVVWHSSGKSHFCSTSFGQSPFWYCIL